MIRAGIRRFFHLALRRRDRWEQEVEEEIALHLRLRAEQLIECGQSPDTAHTEAKRLFGDRSESRARLFEAAHRREGTMRRQEFLADFRQDLLFAVRTLGRQRTWTAVVVLTLALGIGSTTAVFSAVSRLLLHPLNYPHSDRMVFIELQPTSGNTTGISVTMAPSAPVVRIWKQYSHTLEAIEGGELWSRQMKTIGGASHDVSVESVLPTFFRFAGAQPVIGRMFSQEDIDNGGAVALLNESLWRDRFGGDPRILGTRITLGDSTFTVIGVLPASLHVGSESSPAPAVWIPLDIRNDKLGLSALGRLRSGTTPEAAAAELDSIAARWSGFTTMAFRTVVTRPAEQVQYHDALVLLAIAVAFVLLIASANVAHLLLAQSTRRQRELAIRAALGAGRGRVRRQLLTEALLLSTAGTAGGVFVGWTALHGLVALRPPSLDSLRVARLDGTTLGIAVVIALVNTILFSLISGTPAGRSSPHDALKAGAAGNVGGRGEMRTRNTLIVSEMALSAALVVMATLLVRSVSSLQRTNLGFEPNGLYTVNLPLDGPEFRTEIARVAAIHRLTTRLGTLPAVRAITVATVAPGSRWFAFGHLDVQGNPGAERSATTFIAVNAVEPNYFRTMGISLLRGSTFTDTSGTTAQVIVNATFARTHWPGGSALGHRVRIARSDSDPWMTIVGVAHDVRTSGPMGESSAPAFYTPLTSVPSVPAILIRAGAGATDLEMIKTFIQQFGVTQPTAIESVTQTMARSIAGPRFVATLLAAFTIVALLLAAIGLYGVMTYSVMQRAREIGIRVALGASNERIACSVVGHGMRLVGVGVVVGLSAALWGTKLIVGQLHGIERLDPFSYAIGAAVLAGAAVVACIVPTRRALAVDPVTAIRAE